MNTAVFLDGGLGGGASGLVVVLEDEVAEADALPRLILGPAADGSVFDV